MLVLRWYLAIVPKSRSSADCVRVEVELHELLVDQLPFVANLFVPAKGDCALVVLDVGIDFDDLVLLRALGALR